MVHLKDISTEYSMDNARIMDIPRDPLVSFYDLSKFVFVTW
jgi:hypothetical protein